MPDRCAVGRAAVLLVLLGAAVACSGSPGVGESCTDVDACGRGALCFEGRCRASCSLNIDCDADEHCERGVCLAGRAGRGDGGGAGDPSGGGDPGSGGDLLESGDPTARGDETAATGDSGTAGDERASGDERTGDADPGPCPGASEDCDAVVIFMDPADPPPTGWTCLSCSGQPLNHQFLVGAGTYGGTGGGAGHEHAPSGSHTNASSSWGLGLSDGPDRPSSAHVHGIDATLGAPALFPPYLHLSVYISDFPTSRLPAGAVVLTRNVTLPNADFERFSSANGRYVRGAEAGESGQGGAATHAHTLTVTMGDSSGTYKGCLTANDANCFRVQSPQPHTHTVTFDDTDTVSIEPRHVTLSFIRATRATDVPAGIIAMFVTTPQAGWEVLSGSGGVLEGVFIKGGTVPDTAPVGQNTHGHPSQLKTSSSTGHGGDHGTVGGFAARNTHTHDVTVDIPTVDHRPPFTEIIFAERK